MQVPIVPVFAVQNYGGEPSDIGNQQKVRIQDFRIKSEIRRFTDFPDFTCASG